MRYEEGVALEDEQQWQAPAHCFPDDADEDNMAHGRHLKKSVGKGKEEIAVGLQAARLLKKLAGAAAAFKIIVRGVK